MSEDAGGVGGASGAGNAGGAAGTGASESGMGGGSMGPSESDKNDFGEAMGGFGGLGIGNPGSYGGQQSVGAPGFDNGYSSDNKNEASSLNDVFSGGPLKENAPKSALDEKLEQMGRQLELGAEIAKKAEKHGSITQGHRTDTIEGIIGRQIAEEKTQMYDLINNPHPNARADAAIGYVADAVELAMGGKMAKMGAKATKDALESGARAAKEIALESLEKGKRAAKDKLDDSIKATKEAWKNNYEGRVKSTALDGYLKAHDIVEGLSPGIPTTDVAKYTALTKAAYDYISGIDLDKIHDPEEANDPLLP